MPREVAEQPGAIGCSEPARAAPRGDVRTVPLGGDGPDAGRIAPGDSRCPFEDIEYACTYGEPRPASLTQRYRTRIRNREVRMAQG
ncbi:hypothetical protein GCM10010145_22500 [Streptomyces ruber]|uniref:Uncharacterized protein n=2 Tax=Streptomyces TaxID=1883 RepID=A0A918BBB7_9ACTN|nr:hypothetical protein [Streptomyces ruber]GGQ52557.1 hypothetical protein GCM10010145_22500 [Streptomyces ruber]